jgi:polysaccharide transporter, PST family
MAAGRPILRNLFALGGAQVVTTITAMITTIILARVLGPAAYGILGFGVALISYFGLAVNIGMDAHAVRVIARTPAHGNSVVKMLIFSRVLLAATFATALMVAVPLMGWSEQVQTVVKIQCLGLFGVALTLDFFYQARQKMEIVAFRQVAAAIAGMVAVVLWVREADDLFLAASVPITAHILSAAALCVYFLLISRGGAGKLPILSRANFVKRSLPIALMGVLTTIYVNLDIVILGFLVGESEVGLYVAASKILAVAVIVPNLLHSVFYPALAEVMDDDVARERMVENLIRVLAFFGGAVGVAGAVLVPVLLPLLFGAAYVDAEWALRLLMANSVFVYLSVAFGTFLLAAHCDKAYTVILGIGAGLNIGLNFILIPIYGIEGAAAATLATQIVVWMSVMGVAKKAFNLQFIGIQIRAFAVGLVASVPALIMLRAASGDGGAMIFVATVVFLVCYAMLAHFANVIDVRKVVNILKRSN